MSIDETASCSKTPSVSASYQNHIIHAITYLITSAAALVSRAIWESAAPILCISPNGAASDIGFSRSPLPVGSCFLHGCIGCNLFQEIIVFGKPGFTFFSRHDLITGTTPFRFLFIWGLFKLLRHSSLFIYGGHHDRPGRFICFRGVPEGDSESKAETEICRVVCVGRPVCI